MNNHPFPPSRITGGFRPQPSLSQAGASQILSSSLERSCFLQDCAGQNILNSSSRSLPGLTLQVTCVKLPRSQHRSLGSSCWDPSAHPHLHSCSLCSNSPVLSCPLPPVTLALKLWKGKWLSVSPLASHHVSPGDPTGLRTSETTME